jgi:hypothetical protein
MPTSTSLRTPTSYVSMRRAVDFRPIAFRKLPRIADLATAEGRRSGVAG